MSNDVSIEALLNEIWREGGDDSDEGFITVRELSDRTGLSDGTVRDRLREVAKDGKLERRRVYRISLLGGQRHPTNGYRLRRENP